jgi:hypothetical protein
VIFSEKRNGGTMSSRNIIYKGILLALLLAFLIPISLNATSEGAVLWLLIEPGSNAGGMGNAYVAKSDDAFAGWWNPAALAFNHKTQIAGMHSNLLGDAIPDIYYEYLGWDQYFEGVGTLGFNVIYINYGKQDKYTEDNIFKGTFQSYEFATTGSYGFMLTDKLAGGLNFKFIYSKLAPEGTGTTEVTVKGAGSSYAFDLALKAKDVFVPRLDLGWNLQNIGPNITYVNEAQADPLPMNWRIGAAYRVFDSPMNRLAVTADFNKMLANSDPVYERIVTAWGGDKPIYNFGGEYSYMNLISVRGGYIYDKTGDVIGPCFGVGFQYTFTNKYKLTFDFAMVSYGALVDYNKTFSLGLEF